MLHYEFWPAGGSWSIRNNQTGGSHSDGEPTQRLNSWFLTFASPSWRRLNRNLHLCILRQNRDANDKHGHWRERDSQGFSFQGVTSTFLFLLPNVTAASLTAMRPKWPGQKSCSGLGGREGRMATEGEKKAVRGRVDRPFISIGCEVAAEFRIEEQHVLLSKIHTLTRLHADTRAYAASVMSEWPLLLLLLVNLPSGRSNLFTTCLIFHYCLQTMAM